MAKFNINESTSDLDTTPTLNELSHALKLANITIIPNIHTQTNQPILWVSLQDLNKIKKYLNLKDKSEAI